MRVLALNSGSSSVKGELFDMRTETSLRAGIVERVGPSERDRASALDTVLGELTTAAGPEAIGHRIVHGGERFRDPTLLDHETTSSLRDLVALAPLHMGPGIAGVETARRRFPGVPQVAVFDTGFHGSLPEHAYRYALPRDVALEHSMRRYGFHGISHAHMVSEAATWLGRPAASLDLVTLHLGSGASATAVRAGKSVDTSMGMTPLEGLVMGTRPGDTDPGVALYLQRVAGMDAGDVEDLLNRSSGLKGLCGESDMRDVRRLADAGDPDASLALDVFCYRAKKYVGAYLAVLGRSDAIVFSGGIGEHDADVRARVVSGMETLGIRLDDARNGSPSTALREIQADDSAVRVLVVPAAEELEIARQTVGFLQEGRA